jgi:hypothetical protein
VRLFLRILVPAIFLCATFAQATPIKPDLKKLLSQPQPKKLEYVPARAGWDGPEQPSPESDTFTQHYSSEASSRAIRASLLAAAVPDWRAVFAVVVVIFLLRRLRKASPDQAAASHQRPPADIPRAA